MGKKKRKLNHIRKVTNFISQESGRQVERAYYSMAKAGGKEIERTSRGSDYRERPTNIMGKGVGRWNLVEVKTGKAKTSRLQNKTRKKVGKGRDRVVRF